MRRYIEMSIHRQLTQRTIDAYNQPESMIKSAAIIPNLWSKVRPSSRIYDQIYDRIAVAACGAFCADSLAKWCQGVAKSSRIYDQKCGHHPESMITSAAKSPRIYDRIAVAACVAFCGDSLAKWCENAAKSSRIYDQKCGHHPESMIKSAATIPNLWSTAWPNHPRSRARNRAIAGCEAEPRCATSSKQIYQIRRRNSE